MPGLYENEAGRWSVAGATGMLVPVRNIEGRIVALKIRADEAEGSKYTYLSSTKYGGPGPGSQVHVPLHDDLDLNVVRLTEGDSRRTLPPPSPACSRSQRPGSHRGGRRYRRCANSAPALCTLPSTPTPSTTSSSPSTA